MSKAERWNSGATGRNQTVKFEGTVYTVANATNPQSPFDVQVKETLEILEKSLIRAGTNKQSLLSVQILLSDISFRPAFDVIWCEWIGSEMETWPQRACYQVGLAPGLLIEIIAISGKQVTENSVTKVT
ncbi:MAG: hypothetical protein LCH54_17955 [Bacteroidetes bacterium]|nr:hypothetical protein [Bacteroidota bacterium]